MKNTFLKITLLFFLSLLGLISCNQKETANKPSPLPTGTRISSMGSTASSPFLTKDHKNRPVLSWVEGQEKDTYFHYAVSLDHGLSFSKPIKVSTTKGLSNHSESMAKIAFKSNGTAFILFQKRKPNKDNRFAGAIYYTQSKDKETSWTPPQYLHTDTSGGIGRSFFDISTLPDGQIGAIWLDGRKKNKIGSTLYFAKTSTDKGFGKDTEIGNKTCQCCRTDIYVDQHHNINITYRDIIQDTIRDISYIVSKDNGNTFSKPKRISADNWVINGCPHTGPTIAENKEGLHFFWFSKGGGKAGVYHTSTSNHGKTFRPRIPIHSIARHPQSTSYSNKKVALIWNEAFKKNDIVKNKIGYQKFTPSPMAANVSEPEVQYLTPDSVDAHFPVIIQLDTNTLIAAWSQKEKKYSSIYYTQLH